jgi:two-component system heavy metal sensor histidine kinase CusS
VSNSGDEIPAEALPHLFDRFYRVDESRTHKDNSYGLGLAIARSLAEKNQGTITVTSQDGITEFTLRLPISS